MTVPAGRGTEMLRGTARVVMETQEIGGNVVVSLHDQRETLLRSNAKVRVVNRLCLLHNRVSGWGCRHGCAVGR